MTTGFIWTRNKNLFTRKCLLYAVWKYCTENRKKSTTKLGIYEKIGTIGGVLSDYERIMIIDGRAIANGILVDLHGKIRKLPKKPKLSIILV